MVGTAAFRDRAGMRFTILGCRFRQLRTYQQVLACSSSGHVAFRARRSNADLLLRSIGQVVQDCPGVPAS